MKRVALGILAVALVILNNSALAQQLIPYVSAVRNARPASLNAAMVCSHRSAVLLALATNDQPEEIAKRAFWSCDKDWQLEINNIVLEMQANSPKLFQDHDAAMGLALGPMYDSETEKLKTLISSVRATYDESLK